MYSNKYADMNLDKCNQHDAMAENCTVKCRSSIAYKDILRHAVADLMGPVGAGLKG